MKTLYGLSFDVYDTSFHCGLRFDRIKKSPIVKITRLQGDLPFWKYFKMMFFYRIGRWLTWRADVIEYDLKVVSGFEKGIVWRKRADGMYQPYDKIAGMELPHLARVKPPEDKTKKRRKKS